MSNRLCPEQSLLIVTLSEIDFANAFIFLNTIVTAGHVAPEKRSVQVPDTEEKGDVLFNIIPERDLAFSVLRTLAVGVEWNDIPEIGDELSVYGHHGPRKELFIIRAKVLEVRGDGRIVVERISGKRFQPGMSGSPAFTKENAVVGLLVEEVEGSNGEKVILESLAA